MAKTKATRPEAGRPVRKIGFRQRLGRWDVKLSPYLYVSPFFIVFAVVGMFPLLYTAYVSMFDWHLLGGKGEFVGLGNYEFILGQHNFWVAMRNTLSIFVISSVPQVTAAIGIAWVLDANIRAKTFWRMGVLLPYVVAPVAVSVIFSRMFADQFGLVNSVLGGIGIDPIRWHADPLASHFVISVMVWYRWTGYNTLICLAAMQAVPRDLYEAAVIDGASKAKQFFSVTIPQIRPTIIFVIITATIGCLQIFDEPRMYDQFGQGGSDHQWMTATLYLYQLGWNQEMNFGRAASVAWLLFMVIGVIAVFNFALTRRIASDSPDHSAKVRKTAKTRGAVKR
ncbi:MAG: sugar ABC transporter permease [Bifidobacteriaceae bacterium]|nr:sugar ABC transporter permease [Bifidobacteriaceae bacterium]